MKSKTKNLLNAGGCGPLLLTMLDFVFHFSAISRFQSLSTNETKKYNERMKREWISVFDNTQTWFWNKIIIIGGERCGVGFEAGAETRGPGPAGLA
ncbi:hypothetical protein BpHYR1_043938 [Brachionus plicatilis]|uniref:Uncharacterized protein n=1 Tax=Brachionus plicatilis TaxID=10195 RepID=A0A3M7RK22_BRAPC|nr:hypothetical protein BpHYR1_043938 [Brachionus plicatilis]